MVQFQEVQWYGTWQKYLSEVNDKLLYLLLPAIKKKAKCLVGLFFCDRGDKRFLIWLCYSGLYLVVQKAASFKWSLEQERALQQIQAAMQAALSLGPFGVWCDKGR